ncbi:hypothetical protein [Marinifilum fragile]|uniref:hypothetical protein n=1 Tax=Marinifilum fragile TaxID=570161 RepID=UPI002AA78CBB|nr:hypothetical protein [Marinifilum fragile]
MTNIEKYNTAFIDTFSISVDELNDNFTNKSVENWDSIRQLSLIASIEESFDVMFDTEDMLDLTSYKVGKELLVSKYNIKL